MRQDAIHVLPAKQALVSSVDAIRGFNATHPMNHGSHYFAKRTVEKLSLAVLLLLPRVVPSAVFVSIRRSCRAD